MLRTKYEGSLTEHAAPTHKDTDTMDISWLTEPQTWIGFATLLILEVVLGIDNLVFVAILAGKVKPAQRDRARITGLGLAVVIRMFMLAGMAHDIPCPAKT